MLTAFTIAHVVISLILIIMVLLQDSKGDASGLMGGGGQSVFGATGASSFIVKATRTVAALFAAGCLGLAYLTSNQANTSGVFDRVQTPSSLSVPAEDIAPVAPAVEGSAPEKPATDAQPLKPEVEKAKTETKDAPVK